MRQLSQTFLTQQEQRKVTEMVRKMELQTSGEIVPVIVSASHHYPTARLLATLIFSLPLTFILSHLFASIFWYDPKSIYPFFIIFTPVFALGYGIVSRFPLLSKPFIAKTDKIEEVREEATKCFFTEKLHKTRDANGILIFISVFESRVWILGDHGVNERIAPQTWQTIVNELTTRIGKKDRCEALCQAITQIGGILQQHFPYNRDDVDELHNLIIK